MQTSSSSSPRMTPAVPNIPRCGADKPGMEGQGRRGHPKLWVSYCIVRSGWLTDGGGDEPLAVSQGDTAEGRISRADLADVCTQMLLLPDARGKTFEVVAAHAEQALSLASAVAALAPDTDAGPRARAPVSTRSFRPTAQAAARPTRTRPDT